MPINLERKADFLRPGKDYSCMTKITYTYPKKIQARYPYNSGCAVAAGAYLAWILRYQPEGTLTVEQK